MSYPGHPFFGSGGGGFYDTSGDIHLILSPANRVPIASSSCSKIGKAVSLLKGHAICGQEKAVRWICFLSRDLRLKFRHLQHVDFLLTWYEFIVLPHQRRHREGGQPMIPQYQGDFEGHNRERDGYHEQDSHDPRLPQFRPRGWGQFYQITFFGVLKFNMWINLKKYILIFFIEYICFSLYLNLSLGISYTFCIHI